MKKRVTAESMFKLFSEIGKIERVYSVGSIDKTDTGEYATIIWIKS